MQNSSNNFEDLFKVMKNDLFKNLDRNKLGKILELIYHDHDSEELNIVLSQLSKILSQYQYESGFINGKKITPWSQNHSVLITYADSIQKEGEPTLVTLSIILEKYLQELSQVVHILPFLKSTSDGGFAVSSHKLLDEKFGKWKDLKILSKKHILMADIVLNHVSSSHPWVQQFKKGQEPGLSNIFAPSEDLDWSNVIRPRSSSLFSQIITSEGPKRVWTTFGPDQIDLNWQNPRMFLEFLNLVILYINNGIRWFRLDAVGFIWKQSGTTCLHHSKAHLIVKALRIKISSLLSDGVLITETNVPQQENLSYLEVEDEAHMAYNFPLPPLLLEAVVTSRADILNTWIYNWPILPENTTLFNFSASHDGIGLRPLEGLMEEERIKELLINCEKRGGLISHRRLFNGEDKPYELNISWWSAMEDSSRDSKRYQQERFLLSQLLVMSLKGVPAFYLPALLGSENDIKRFSMTGERRDLNREKFDFEKLLIQLENKNSIANKNIRILSKAMKIRSKFKSFHPSAKMKCLTKGRRDIVAIQRGLENSSIFAIHNITDNKLNFSIDDSLKSSLDDIFTYCDYLSGKKYKNLNFVLEPFEVLWIGKIND